MLQDLVDRGLLEEFSLGQKGMILLCLIEEIAGNQLILIQEAEK
jgi:hypothetical protein